MKFKSISNICFWQVFYYHSCVAIVRIFIETVHHLLSHAFYRNCSLFDSQLLISYTSAIRSFFTINGVSTTNGTPSKIQIRVTNYPLRDNLFLFSRVCVYRRYIRSQIESHRISSRYWSRDDAYISSTTLTFFRYYPSRIGGSSRDGEVKRPWREFPRGWDREWNAKFFSKLPRAVPYAHLLASSLWFNLAIFIYFFISP